MMRTYVWVVLIFGLTLMLGGCRGGGHVEQPPDQELPAAVEELATYNGQRMQEVPDPDTAVVEGLLAIEGFTVIGAGAGGGGATSAISPVPDQRIMVRLVNPDEDILAAVNPNLAGEFEIVHVGAALDAKLEFEFQVAEDLDGDGEGEDVVLQAVPVALAPGLVTQVSLTLASAVMASLDGPPGALGPEFDEAAPQVVLAELMMQDANGFHKDFYGVFYGERYVVFDSDGDQFLEEGDDFSGPDTNGDGWIDFYEQSFSAPEQQLLFLEGTVVAVDIAAHTLELEQGDGIRVTVLVDPFTTVEVLTKGGYFIGPLTLDNSLVGRDALVDAIPGPDGSALARWIVMLEEGGAPWRWW